MAGPEESPPFYWNVLKLAGRILISGALLWLLAVNVDKNTVANLLAKLSALEIAVIVLMLTAGSFVNAVRWRFILRARNHEVGMAMVMKLVFIGLFFNQALPSTIGGDAIRILHISKSGVPLGETVQSVLIDRMGGLFSMIVLTLAGLPILMVLIDDGTLWGVVALLGGFGLAGFMVLATLDLFPRFEWLPGFIHHVHSFSGTARDMIFSRRHGWPIMAYSMIGQLLTVSAFLAIGQALNIDVAPIAWFAIIPPILMATILPVSLAGWGLREGMIVFALAFFGVNIEQALTASVLFGFAQIIRSLPGGLFWLAAPKYASAPQIPPRV